MGNFDRHTNNWAYLMKNDDTKLQFDPTYDCDSYLYPQVSDDVIPSILASQDEMQKRIDKFPTATLLLPDKTKANYGDFIIHWKIPTVRRRCCVLCHVWT